MPAVHCLVLDRAVPRDLFFFNDTATTEIYTLSLHDALPISRIDVHFRRARNRCGARFSKRGLPRGRRRRDRKSTRLNSSHVRISYAVFCLKKKKNTLIAEALQTDPPDPTLRGLAGALGLPDG